MKKVNSALLFCLALTACNASNSDAGPGGVNAEDAQALDDAAEKLDIEAEPNGATAARP